MKYLRLTLVALIITSLLIAMIPATVNAQTQVVQVVASGTSINVTINVPANVTSALLITTLMKLSSGSEELVRFYVTYVVGGDVVKVNNTGLPKGNYVVKVMVWNGLLSILASEAGKWQTIMYYEENVTLK